MVGNLWGINQVDIWGTGREKKKRKPIRTGTKTNILADSGAKCQKCRKPLKGLKPHIHHKNHNPSDNRKGNLILLCPNCHSKMHRTSKPKMNKKPKNSFDLGVPKFKPIKWGGL